MRLLLCVLVSTSILLAGCGTKATVGPDAVDPCKALERSCEVDDDKGILAGVVASEAIVPIPNAKVSIVGPGGVTADATTDPEGRFLFDALPAGAYAIKAAKPGYEEGQTTATVVAKRLDAPLVRLLLREDALTKPFASLFRFDGYIECSGAVSAVGSVALCSVANIPSEEACARANVCLGNATQDTFNTFVPIDRVPDWVQHELVWESTQTTGNALALAARTATQEQNDAGTYDRNWGRGFGKSPLVVYADNATIEKFKMGINGTGLAPAIFAGGMEETVQCFPLDPTFCSGTGVTLQQRFSLYTTVFYGYRPPEGWSFASGDGLPPAP